MSEPMEGTLGGLDGLQLDLQLDPAWNATCYWSDGLPAVPLIHSLGHGVGGFY